MTEVLVEDRSARIRIVPPPTRHSACLAVCRGRLKKCPLGRYLRRSGFRCSTGCPTCHP